MGSDPAMARLFLAGDVMTGRGIDQILPHPANPRIFEQYVEWAGDYVTLAERKCGPIPRRVSFEYIWGPALDEFEVRRPDVRIINLETAITERTTAEPKGINYKMSPANVGVIKAAQIDCCALANNHVLDWGASGLLDTIHTLKSAGVRTAGAGIDLESAVRPAVIDIGDAQLFVFSFAAIDSGVPRSWAAAPAKPGVNLIADISARSAEKVAEHISSTVGKRHPVVASIHWGGNWGYAVANAHADFARRLIDAGSVDVVHGHSCHHVKAIEVYRGKLILYGCGDLINDYEGITVEEDFRDDLGLMYFPTIRKSDGTLCNLDMVPTRVRQMRLNRASRSEAGFLTHILCRDGADFGTEVLLDDDNVLRLKW